MPLHAVGRHAASAPSPGHGESAGERAARHDARALLLARLCERIGGDAPWLEDCLAAVADSDPTREPRTFDLALALAPVRLGRDALVAGDEARARFRTEADGVLDGWRPERCRVDEAVRALLLTAAGDAAVPTLLARALRREDDGARPALYRSLPLLPRHDVIVDLVREGIGTGRRDVFEAIAHANPWPARHLGDDDWNRLVLGALFTGSPLAPIHGLDERVGERLATMLLDHALACRAADRAIPVELWRALGPFATRAALEPFLPGGGALDAPWPDDATHAALARAVIRSGDPALAALARRRARPRSRLVGVPSTADTPPRRGA